MELLLLALGCADHHSGTGGSTQVDVFGQAADDELDVLWVVSDAASMGEAQAALGEGVEAFAEEAEARGLDVHAGVLSTSFRYEDPDRGTLVGDPPWLGTEDLRTGLPERFLVGTEATDERGTDVARFALDPTMTVDGGPNAGFRRPDAGLALVFVSTRDDDADLREELLLPPEEVVHDLAELAGGRDRLVILAVVGGSDSACAEQEGDRYLTLAALTGGALADVCDLPGDPSLGFPDLSGWSGVLLTEFQLTSAPVVSTLEVSVGDEVVQEDPTSGWTYDPDVGPAGAIVFHADAVPPHRAQITVRYDER